MERSEANVTNEMSKMPEIFYEHITGFQQTLVILFGHYKPLNSYFDET